LSAGLATKDLSMRAGSSAAKPENARSIMAPPRRSSWRMASIARPGKRILAAAPSKQSLTMASERQFRTK
jgi:hypothetical protein